MSDKAVFLFLEHAQKYHVEHFHSGEYEECQNDVCRIAREEATELASLHSALAAAREALKGDALAIDDALLYGNLDDYVSLRPELENARKHNAAALAALPAVRK